MFLLKSQCAVSQATAFCAFPVAIDAQSVISQLKFALQNGYLIPTNDLLLKLLSTYVSYKQLLISYKKFY